MPLLLPRGTVVSADFFKMEANVPTLMHTKASMMSHQRTAVSDENTDDKISGMWSSSSRPKKLTPELRSVASFMRDNKSQQKGQTPTEEIGLVYVVVLGTE